jgi:hypothetical protein
MIKQKHSHALWGGHLACPFANFWCANQLSIKQGTVERNGWLVLRFVPDQ